MSTLLLVLIILVVVAVIWGGYGGYSRAYSPLLGWSPLGLVLLVILLLWLLGALRV